MTKSVCIESSHVTFSMTSIILHHSPYDMMLNVWDCGIVSPPVGQCLRPPLHRKPLCKLVWRHPALLSWVNSWLWLLHTERRSHVHKLCLFKAVLFRLTSSAFTRCEISLVYNSMITISETVKFLFQTGLINMVLEGRLITDSNHHFHIPVNILWLSQYFFINKQQSS